MAGRPWWLPKEKAQFLREEAGGHYANPANEEGRCEPFLKGTQGAFGTQFSQHKRSTIICNHLPSSLGASWTGPQTASFTWWFLMMFPPIKKEGGICSTWTLSMPLAEKELFIFLTTVWACRHFPSYNVIFPISDSWESFNSVQVQITSLGKKDSPKFKSVQRKKLKQK